MGSTSNYSWPTPEQTDLVKDGWDAIKDLGDAADTTVKAVADGRGLVHIDTETFSGAVSISLDNVFTSTYDNYKIIVDLDATTSTDSTIALRLRASGTDATGSNYAVGYAGWASSSAVANADGSSQTQAYLFRLESTANQHYYSATIDLLRPQKAERTIGLVVNSGIINTGFFYGAAGAFMHDVSTAYDGFTLFAGYNIAGKVRVYGYKN